MLVYIDSENKCHMSDDGTMQSYEVEFFDGKCPAFVEGYKYYPEAGGIYVPWRDYSGLTAIQTAVDRAQAQAQQTINEYEQALSEIETALGVTSK